MKSVALAVVACLLLSITILTGCSTDIPVYSLNQKFTLSPGKSAVIESEDMTITFDKVLNDSRCPESVTCIWAGQVQVLVTIELDGRKETLTLTQSGLTGDPASQLYEKYVLEFNISPYPQTEQTIRVADYRLEITVRI
ncbi:hypothetical protein ABFB09_06665 [Dehalogenimonas sp. THU2]|uniref:hypothetical protein n=1 Tax=Dehalogenimonas sp. THU2 TaxID=3151121 RepID=UPI0032188C2E